MKCKICGRPTAEGSSCCKVCLSLDHPDPASVVSRKRSEGLVRRQFGTNLNKRLDRIETWDFDRTPSAPRRPDDDFRTSSPSPLASHSRPAPLPGSSMPTPLYGVPKSESEQVPARLKAARAEPAKRKAHYSSATPSRRPVLLVAVLLVLIGLGLGGLWALRQHALPSLHGPGHEHVVADAGATLALRL